MILAAVDDLMFASKIRTAARQLGATVIFVRSATAVLEHARAMTPSLAIFDLNGEQLQPLATIARLKADPALASIPTLGFVSHVRSDVIAAARDAGVDEVMARSAFTARLSEILMRQSSKVPAARPSASPSTLPFDLREVLEARRRIAGRVRRTPLAHSPWLSSESRAEVHLKLESLQVTHSFKVRGALNAAMALLERPHGDTHLQLVTASAGNHGRALAFAAEALGLSAIVFTPRDAARTKLEAIRRHGADLQAVADSYEHAEQLAKEFARSTGAVFISPYSHPDIVAGTGTIALEILEDLPDLDVLIAAVGGGGLISGVAATLKTLSRRIDIVGVEAAASPAFFTSLRDGRITEIEVKPTIADGLAGNMDPETMTFELVQQHVRNVVLVTEEELASAVRGLAAEEHLIAEGAGIAGTAAVLSGKLDLRGLKVAVIVSGSNIDAQRLAGLLSAP